METAARKYRYNVLAQACLARDISYILLAHHEDDDYETFLCRISAGHTDRITIRADNPIPEVSPVYGIHGGGGLDLLPVFERLQKPIEFANRVVGFERGCLRVARPLLDFPKQRLIATCQEFGLPWKEDESNKDPTLTVRNAVRHMIQKQRLPAALTKDNFLRLRKSFQEREQREQDLTEQLFNLADISLDVRSGTAKVRFPSHAVLKRLVPNIASLGRVVTKLLGKVQCLVFPLNHSVSQSQNPTEIVEFLSPDPSWRSRDIESDPPPYFRIGRATYKGTTYDDDSAKDHQLDPWTYTLYRTPFEWSVSHDNSAFDSYSNVNVRIPRQSEDHEPEFHLWDDRFWIRVRHHFDKDVWIRPFTASRSNLLNELIQQKYFDFSILDLNLLSGTSKTLSEVINKLAPSNIRYSLPILEGPPLPGGEYPLPIAIPTLGIRLTPRGKLCELWKWPDFSWEVRYPDVDLGPNWKNRLVPEDEKWSWNQPAKVERPALPPKAKPAPPEIINSSDELRSMILRSKEQVAM